MVEKIINKPKQRTSSSTVQFVITISPFVDWQLITGKQE